jgi:hypothetical protein
MPEFQWLAHYDDGSSYRQGNFGDIQRNRLVAFDLLKDNELCVRVDLRVNDSSDGIEPKRLIYRRRTRKSEKGDQLVFHLIGWQRKVLGRNIQSIAYVFEDGGVLLGGQFTGQDFQHAIVPLEFEADLRD